MSRPHSAMGAAAALLLLGSSAACEAGAPARVRVPADGAAGEIPFRLAGPADAAIIVPVFVDGTVRLRARHGRHLHLPGAHAVAAADAPEP